MQDYFESQGDDIDPDSFNNNQGYIQQVPDKPNNQIIRKDYSNIDDRLEYITNQLAQFKQMVTLSGNTSENMDHLKFIDTLYQELNKIKLDSNMDEIEMKLLLNRILFISNSASATINVECRVKNLDEIAKDKQNYSQLEKKIFQLELLFGKNRDTLLLEGTSVLKDLASIEENLKDLKEMQLTDFKNSVYSISDSLEKQTADNLSTLSIAQLQKINLNYERLAKLQGLFDILPRLSEKLQNLKQVHEMSVGFQQQIESLTKEQIEVVQLMNQFSEKISKVGQKLVLTYKKIFDELQKLDDQIQKL